MKFGIEHYRRRQPHCSGTLVWQFNDVWPGFSWSVVDYDVVPKASYFALRRTFAPVVATFAETAAALELWVSNSTPHPVSTTAVVTFTDADGATLSTLDVPVTLAAGESRSVWARSERLPTGHWVWVHSPDDAFPRNRLFGGEVKDLHLSPDPLQWTFDPATAAVTLHATALTYQARVTTVPGVHYSDNYVDLRPGEEATIVLDNLPKDFDPDTITVRAYGSP